jgi:acyl-CoA reductase-like NAD-dependent aldehyde dehydrogenase
MVDAAIKQDGARLVQGGQRLTGDFAEGYFLPPTIVADVDQKTTLAQQEVFGPVLAVTPFDTEDEVIAVANGTSYGLGAYVHTQNLRRAHYVASQMQAGMIHVNGSGEGMQPFAPFGGMKQSGYGRLGGQEGLHEFLQVKNVWMNLAKPQAPSK